jgi:hypothetical protein
MNLYSIIRQLMQQLFSGQSAIEALQKLDTII